MNRTKVLLLITKSSLGGAQRYVYDLATSLPDERFDVVVALGGDGPLVRELEKARIRVIHIPGLQRDISLFKELRSFWNIYKIIRAESPHVLHVNSSKAGGIGALVGRICGIAKIVYTAHGWAFNEDRNILYRAMIGYLHWVTIMLSHTTIAVSEKVRKEMKWPFAQRKMVTIHNGRPTPQFHTRAQARDEILRHVPALAPFQNDFWSVTIAELHPIKQHGVTIRALKNVVSDNPSVRHVIIGEGQERATLEQLVVANNLSEHVFFAGGLPEAAQYLKAFDLFVLSSRSEALAYVVIEACLASLPIIASRVGGLPEIISNEEIGVLVPEGDVEALTKSYTSLYKNPEKRNEYAKKASDRATFFSLEKMLSKTVSVYEE